MKLSFKKFKELIEEKISPLSFNEKGTANMKLLFGKYPPELLLECIDIGVSKYIKYNSSGLADEKSVDLFLSKIGGIAFNKSQNKVDTEIIHILNIGKKAFDYWSNERAKQILSEYIHELRKSGCKDENIVEEYLVRVKASFKVAGNWTNWTKVMNDLNEEAKKYKKEELLIEQHESIIPNVIFDKSMRNISLLCQQINGSYENSMYDCTAVIMRRLLEVLLILSFQKIDSENEIIDKSGNYVTLEQIINLASQNTKLGFTPNTKKQLKVFQVLGNYSAHKIWYNCTKSDIEPLLSKYRSTIEELMYKAGQLS